MRHSALDDSSTRGRFSRTEQRPPRSISGVARSFVLPLLLEWSYLPTRPRRPKTQDRGDGEKQQRRGSARGCRDRDGPVNRSQLSDPDGRYAIAGLPPAYTR